MASHPWEVLTICMVMSAGAEQHANAAMSEGDPIVAVTILDPNELAGPSLVRAQHFATGIFGQAGVTLRWALDGSAAPDRELTIVLTTSTQTPAGLEAGSIGVAPSPGDGTRGTTAYILMDKVRAFAESNRVLELYVLASAFAHEIGHLLLPPNAHRPDGIMRALLDPSHFPPRAPGIVGFPPDQAKLLRLRARRQ